jgi:hypothetical protein
VYYNCLKFHKNPISCLGGVALTRYMPPSFSHEGIWLLVQNLKGEIIQLILSRKGGGMDLVSATPPKRLIGVL